MIDFKLYLKFDKGEKKPKTIQALLQKALCGSDRIGCYGSFALATYYDKNCNQIQCGPGKNRSFDDILALCKTYFPSATPKKVFLNLLKIKKIYNCETYFPRFDYCGTIQKKYSLFL